MASEGKQKKVVRRIKAKVGDGAKSSATSAQAKTATVKKKATASTKPAVKTKATSSTSVAKKSKTTSAKSASGTNSKPVWVARPFIAIGHYFRDSWRELKQVQWPNRAATWKLTLAIVVFCIVIGIFITLCDFVSQWLIEEVIL